MTNNVKKKLGYSINIFLMIMLISVLIPTGQALVSANRAIDNSVLMAGNSTNVTVVIQNDVTHALSLKETVPSGWNLTRGTDDADQFKASTNEWAWLTVTGDVIKTVTYKVTVPLGTAPGVYDISGETTASGIVTNVLGSSTIEVKYSLVPTQGKFEFAATPLFTTVSVGETAKYNLILTNTGNETDTYRLVADEPNGTTVTLASSSMIVTQGNVAVTELTVVGSATGTYTVNVKATSGSDTNNSKTATITTDVIEQTGQVLSIENFQSVPSSAISGDNPAQIYADVKKGLYNIVQVEFGIIDSDDLLGKGADTIITTRTNTSGVEGLYTPEHWPASYVTMNGIVGNVAAEDIVSTNIGEDSEFAKVRGVFKENNASGDTDAVISFNRTTGDMSDVAEFATGNLLTIQNADSTFQPRMDKFIDGNVTSGNVSTNVFTLYSATGNVAIDNPHITAKAVPDGNYKVYAFAKDTNGSVYKLIDVDTKPLSTGGGGSGDSSGSGSGSGGDGGTYPTTTSTPKKNVTVTPTVTTTGIPKPITTTATQTAISPSETVNVTPIATKPKGSPGIGIVAAIGIIGTIYIIRRRK